MIRIIITMSLIEKHTPKTFKEIVGNKTTYEKLLKDLEKSKFKGKYLLSGKPGTGKTTFVNILSKLKKWKISEVKMSEIQTRGSDEPMTTFAQCSVCNNQWVYSG